MHGYDRGEGGSVCLRVCMCVWGVGVAAEVISLGVWLDHIPLPVFSCCGWGFAVGLFWKKRRGWTEKERAQKEEERWGEVGMDMVKDGWRGLRDGQCRQFSVKQHQRYAPEVARLVHMSSSAPVLFNPFLSLPVCLLHSPTC